MSSPNSRGIDKSRSTFFNAVDLPSITPDDVMLTGFLIKEGGSWKSWKRRFFVLSKTGTLNYFEDANMLKAKGTLECTDSEVRQLPDQGPFFFEIAAGVFSSVSGRCMKVEAESEEQMHEWLQAIRQVSCLYGDNRDLAQKNSDSPMRDSDGMSNISTNNSCAEGEGSESEDEDCEPLC